MSAGAMAEHTEAANHGSPLALGDLALRFDLSGALHLPDHDTLVVADLHFEKGSSRARRGFMLPPYDTRETIARLARVLAAYAPRRVIALGDSFHDTGGPGRLVEEDRAALAALQRGREWIWITGNHDPMLPASLGGEVVAEIEIAGVAFRHEPGAGGAREIAGHLHPVAKVVSRGGRARRRCFARSERRCILPAFGAYAGGLNVRDAAFAPLFPEGLTAHLIGMQRIYAIDRERLSGD
jgi:uncharacterized protein